MQGGSPVTKRIAKSNDCRAKCAGGHPCNCDGDTEHTLHICKRIGCQCHQAEAYGVELVGAKYQRRNWQAVGLQMLTVRP